MLTETILAIRVERTIIGGHHDRDLIIRISGRKGSMGIAWSVGENQLESCTFRIR